MRIIVVGSAATLHVQRWVAFLEEKGHLVTVLTDAPGPTGVRTSRLVPLPMAGWPRSLRYLLGAMRLRRLIAKGGANVVHLQSVGATSLLAWVVPARMLVITPWGSEIAATRRGVKWMFIQWALRRALLILTTSRDMADAVISRANVDHGRVRTISWGVDARMMFAPPSSIAGDRHTLGLPGDATIVTSVRTMAPTYRTMEIVEAFGGALNHTPRLHLVLIRGHDPANRRAFRAKRRYERAVLDVAHSWPSGSYTFIAELLRPALMMRLLRATDIAVSIPRTDQRASTVLEALGACATVMGPRIGPYRELQREGYALILLGEPIVPALTAALKADHQVAEVDRERNRRLVVQRESAEFKYSEVVHEIEAALGRVGVDVE
jgi:hypothetical protein